MIALLLAAAAFPDAATSWNKPAAVIPHAPKDVQTTAERGAPGDVLPARTAEEQAVVAAGWLLDAPTQRKGALAVVHARTRDADGMGRPHHMQAFVFAKGKFAGSLSPAASMAPRTDGALDAVTIVDDHHLRASYVRYAKADALCCPSRLTRATFTVDGAAPVVRATAVETVANQE